MASSILSVATALPPHRMEAAEALAMLGSLWPELARFDTKAGELGTRYLCQPLDRALAGSGLGDANRAYAMHAQRLGAEAASLALKAASLDADRIDLIITVSCTGYLLPSLDAYLIPELGMRPDVIRLPITELGCSGGTAALALADRHLRAFPEQHVLVVAVEIPSLTFQAGDHSMDNVTACLTFGDGAGAAVLGGGRNVPGLSILGTSSRLIPNTRGVLGFELRGDGFHVVLDRRLPGIIARDLGAAVGDFATGCGLEAWDFVAAHAAGPRIFRAIESALKLAPPGLEVSRQVFAEVGNISSASIFFTLRRLVESLGSVPAAGLGLGIGPGVSLELMHLAWWPPPPARDEPGNISKGAPVGSRLE